MLRGALAASVTPLRDGGASLDEDAFEPLVAFLAASELDGILACGTTGEGILLSVEERRRAAELFLAARPDGFVVAVHCGAQTTADTVSLARHAAEAGADAVAAIGPPYFAFDQDSLLAHFRSAADACAPVPFYLYEFAARSGYDIPIPVIERLREAVPNLAGLKVSDRPFEKVEPYLIDGLDVLIGSEPLVLQGLERGAVGTVSGLAAAFPEVIAALAHEHSREANRIVVMLRDRLSRVPFHASLKVLLAARGVPVREDVRAPLRTLSEEERSEVLRVLDAASLSPKAASPRSL